MFSEAWSWGSSIMPAWLGRHLAPPGPPGLWPAAAALCRADWTAVVAVKCQTKHPLLPLILQGRQGTSIPTSDFKVERALDSVQAVSVPATNPRHPSSLRPVPRPLRVLSELGPGELALSGDGVPAHQPHPRRPGAQSLWTLHQPLQKDAPQNSAAASDKGACQTRGRAVGRGAPGSRADSVSTWTPQKLCAFSLSTRSTFQVRRWKDDVWTEETQEGCRLPTAVLCSQSTSPPRGAAQTHRPGLGAPLNEAPSCSGGSSFTRPAVHSAQHLDPQVHPHARGPGTWRPHTVSGETASNQHIFFLLLIFYFGTTHKKRRAPECSSVSRHSKPRRERRPEGPVRPNHPRLPAGRQAGSDFQRIFQPVDLLPPGSVTGCRCQP